MKGTARTRRMRAECVPRQQGLAMVELTICSPLLLLLLYAITEFGNMLYQYAQLANAVRNADRYLGSKARDSGTGLPNVLPYTSATQNLVVYGTRLAVAIRYCQG